MINTNYAVFFLANGFDIQKQCLQADPLYFWRGEVIKIHPLHAFAEQLETSSGLDSSSASTALPARSFARPALDQSSQLAFRIKADFFHSPLKRSESVLDPVKSTYAINDPCAFCDRDGCLCDIGRYDDLAKLAGFEYFDLLGWT